MNFPISTQKLQWSDGNPYQRSPRRTRMSATGAAALGPHDFAGIHAHQAALNFDSYTWELMNGIAMGNTRVLQQQNRQFA